MGGGNTAVHYVLDWATGAFCYERGNPVPQPKSSSSQYFCRVSQATFAVFPWRESKSLVSSQAFESKLPPGPRVGSNRLLGVLVLRWRSPESDDVWYTPKQLKKSICLSSGGGGG